MRANISVMCGENEDIKQKYLQYIKKKKIQHRVVSYKNKAMELYGTLKLTKAKRDRVIRYCAMESENYLSEGQNVFLDIPVTAKRDRIDFLYARRKMMRSNDIKCWCSLMIFDTNKVEMPEEDEGWNDILIFKNNQFTTIECHRKLIL